MSGLWEELDVSGDLFGVFELEGLSRVPLAIFQTREQAEAWAHEQSTDEEFPEWAVSEVRRLFGWAWNGFCEAPDGEPGGSS